MSLYQTQYPNNSRVVSGTPAIFKDDVVLLCDTSSGAVIIDLLEIPDNYWNTTWKLYVVDNSSNASVNNITINAGLGQSINGASSITLSTNDESAVIRISSNNQFVATLSVAQSGGSAIAVSDEGNLLTSNVSSFDFQGELVKATAVGNDVTVDVTLYDSGWLNLPYYNNYAQGNYGIANINYQPKIRVVNRQVFIIGLIVLPLSNKGTLVNNFASYPLTTSTDLYGGTDGGYGVNLNYTITSMSPILPTNLLPETNTFIMPNIFVGRRIISNPCITVSSTPPPSNSKYPMITYMAYGQVFSSGQLYIATLPYIESDNLGFLNPYSDLRRNVSCFETGDVANTFTGYKNSFTGLSDNAVVSPSKINFNIDFDPSVPSQLGGFQVQVNSSWLISKSVSIDDIKNAVNNLTTL